MVWQVTYGGPEFDDFGLRVLPTPDGGYLLASSIFFQENLVLGLIKTDASGQVF
ncbi:MAG: hypothetical protein HC913_00590 [Microscillaceae bacterium]|nr:hypothetical protein [Microscillaceae bacterium]